MGGAFHTQEESSQALEGPPRPEMDFLALACECQQAFGSGLSDRFASGGFSAILKGSSLRNGVGLGGGGGMDPRVALPRLREPPL